MGISIGLVGLGSFGSAFAPLFKAHPFVDRLALCDAEESKLRPFLDNPAYRDKLNPRDLFTSLDDICRADLDALVIITQPWLHAPQCLQAMEHGKHVYSAVPVISLPDFDEILDWCGKVIETTQRTGKHYMLGETTVYRPQTMLCRRLAAENAFGNFVYAEGEYVHDLDSTCSLRGVKAHRTTGKIGAQYEALMQPYMARGCLSSPMSYPTHSIAGPMTVMQTKARKVSACGYRNANRDPFFADSAFSNVTALFHLANGCALRITEAREMSGNTGCDDEDFRLFGTRGSYSLKQWRSNGRDIPDGLPKPVTQTTYDAADMRDPLPREVAEAFKHMLTPDAPAESDFVPGGHGGSHPYLVHEFVSAIATGRRPAISAWDAASWMAMGAAAHRSALRDGEIETVFDFGNPPA